ncbi:hypothetical protein cypCar_00014595 [Cyprinus carpio]|nr:hypothetical protein cypCar_00014595 [Cyprinus carpio]
MCTYASDKPDLAINTLREDCADPSPMVRGMPGMTEYIEQPIVAGLRDKASYVRRVAVLGCAKMHSLEPNTEIGCIARTYSEKCLDIPTGLLELKQDHITSAVIQAFRDLVWFCPQSTAAVCQTVEACVDGAQDSEGKQALLWLLGEHGDQISSAPYVMEGYIDV